MQSTRIRLLFDSHFDSCSNGMARQQQRLSALQVTKLTKPGLYGDGGGLTLQITPTGVKSWLFRYMVDGKAFGMGLGPTHTVSLAEARKKALDARKLLIDGINPLSASRTKNHPSLPWPRVGAFMSALRLREGVSARAVEFAILTACRSGEVRGARWAEFDIGGKLWTIPAARMKAKREHQVPLSDPAVALLASIRKGSEEDIVFAGTKGQPLSDMGLTAMIRRMNGDDKPIWVDANGDRITVHGFRSSFRMWAAEATDFPREVAEHALAHQLPDTVERAYQRGSQFAKRAALMAQWALYCATATVPADAGDTPILGAT